jgi:hypothetical protein
MSREIMQQALDKFEHLWEIGIDAEYKVDLMPEIRALRAELAKPEPQVCCGDYEKCWKACTPRGRWLAEQELAKPEQELAVQHLWECLGRWSSYLVVNGTQANMAPPNWLLDAVIAATSPPRKPWVGLTEDEIFSCFAMPDMFALAHAVEIKLKDKNT